MTKKIADKIALFLDQHTSEIFDVDEGKLAHVPRKVIWMVYLMSVSVLAQGIFDIIIKFAGYTPWFVMFPWRVDFLFLTAISVLMGYQALMGMRRREIDVTRNSVQIGLLVEVALFVGDIYFIYEYYHILPESLPVRLPFIILTFFNILILVYLVATLRLFVNHKGKMQLF